MDWSLMGCGAGGHVTFAPDEPGLRDRFGHATREGQAWRCLRCGAFVIGEPAAGGPADGAPQVRRGTQVRSAFILRVFAVERFIRAVVFAALAIAIWRFSLSRLSLEESYDRALPPLRALLTDLGFSVQHSKVLGLINRAFTTDPKILGYLAIGCAAYALVEVIEGVGLWLVKRWGEYFAMIATSVGLPYEVYDLTNKVTALRVVAFVINLGLVLYLVLTKRLFGARGGKEAYEARLRSESILDAEIAALAAEARGEREQPAEPGRHARPAAPGPPASGSPAPGSPAPGAAPGTGEPPPPAAASPAEDGGPATVREPFEAAEEPGSVTEPVPASEPPWPAAARPPGAPEPATEPFATGDPPADHLAPGAGAAPDARETDGTAPPPLPRRHPPA
jgi:uncharacterized membrane protein (DUF2068 family)